MIYAVKIPSNKIQESDIKKEEEKLQQAKDTYSKKKSILNDNARKNMEKEIQAAQPARAGYILRQNLNLNDFGLTVPVTDVDEFDLVNCITRNALATTGYDGLTEAT